MDSPVSKRSLKGVTEGNPSRWPFPWSKSWELCAALLVPVFQELIRKRVSGKWCTQRKKMQYIGSLKVERPLTIPPFLFFHNWGWLWILFVKKARPNWVCLVWTILVERHWYTTNIITRIIISVTALDQLLCVMLWNHPRGSSLDNWSASCSAKVSKLLEESRLLEKVSKISFSNNCTFKEALSHMFYKWNFICSR